MHLRDFLLSKGWLGRLEIPDGIKTTLRNHRGSFTTYTLDVKNYQDEAQPSLTCMKDHSIIIVGRGISTMYGILNLGVIADSIKHIE